MEKMMEFFYGITEDDFFTNTETFVENCVPYIEVDKSIEELEEDFINDFISFRKENNLTQEMLAEYSKVSRTKIARIESGMHSPSVKALLDILGPLGYTIKIDKVKRNHYFK